MRIQTVIVLLAGCLAAHTGSAEEPVIGGPCEGCENVFVGIPEDLGSTARIAPAGAAGEPLEIEGIVRASDGSPVPGIIVYAYHTSAGGVYPRAETRHGAFRGWARTDADGRYRFHTIRPGAYPGRNIPQHVHMHVIEPGRATYWIDDIVFEDDPLLTDGNRSQHIHGRGGPGVASPRREADGTWRVRRDITLGMGVSGYP